MDVACRQLYVAIFLGVDEKHSQDLPKIASDVLMFALMSCRCISTTALLLLDVHARSEVTSFVRRPLCGICQLRHEQEWHLASKHYDHKNKMYVMPFAELCISHSAILNRHGQWAKLNANNYKIITRWLFCQHFLLFPCLSLSGASHFKGNRRMCEIVDNPPQSLSSDKCSPSPHPWFIADGANMNLLVMASLYLFKRLICIVSSPESHRHCGIINAYTPCGTFLI